MVLDALLQSLLKKHDKTIDLSLGRVRTVFEALDLNSWDCPIIHVAGTNGKGTTVAALNAIYTQADYRVGVFTSPHLYHYCERIRVGNQLISEDDFCESLLKVKSAAADTTLTLFESIFLASLVYFSSQNLDLMVIEVGLGGRLDATNVLDCDYGIITSISLDHQDYLGDSLDAIAKEKGGIIKPAMHELIHAVEKHAGIFDQLGARHGVKVSCLGRDFFCEEGRLCHWHEGLHSVSWSNTAVHASNLSCVLQCINALQLRLPLAWQSLSSCLSQLQVPGRREQWALNTKVWLDVAHNQASSHALSQWALAKGKGTWVAVIAIQKTKDLPAILSPWLPIVSEWWCVDKVADTMISVADLSHYLRLQGCCTVKEFDTMQEVVKRCREAVAETEQTIVFGSFLTVESFMKNGVRTKD